VQTLQQESKNLNEQLAGERETTDNFRKSFETSVSDQLKRSSDYETEIASLKESKGKAELSLLKAKNQRNILFFILSAFAGILGVWVFLKLPH